MDFLTCHKTHACLFFAAFAFFSMFTPLGQAVSDTAYSVETAKSLVYRKGLSIDKNWVLRHAKPGRNNLYYSKYGIGYAVSFVPEICIAALISKVMPSHKEYIERGIVSFTNTLYASCIAVLFFILFVKLGYSPKLSLAAVIVICSSSILLPYSKIIQSEMLTALVLLLFLIIVAGAKKIGPLLAALLGCLLAGLYLVKISNIIFAVVFGLYVAYQMKKGNCHRGPGVLFLCISILPLAGLLYLNWYRFGAVFNFGYGEEQKQFSTPLLTGLRGLLFSPSKSLFIFSPLIVTGFLGIKSFFIKHRLMTVIILSFSIVDVVFYARWHDWPGGWAWGPRLIVPVIIIMHVFCIEFLKPMNRRVWAKSVFATLFVVAFGIQFLGSMISYQQIHYFYSDPFSVHNSQIEVAAKLFMHKARGKEEIYTCKDFNFDCQEKPYERDGRTFGGSAYDFRDRGTFLGFATLWSGIHYNFGWKYIEYFPLILLFFSVACAYAAWKTIPAI
ncbi:MAG: hypothetical protein WBM07_03850 [Chitinivibrionales bacterium]